jgi:hypothetical protein
MGYVKDWSISDQASFGRVMVTKESTDLLSGRSYASLNIKGTRGRNFRD